MRAVLVVLVLVLSVAGLSALPRRDAGNDPVLAEIGARVKALAASNRVEMVFDLEPQLGGTVLLSIHQAAWLATDGTPMLLDETKVVLRPVRKGAHVDAVVVEEIDSSGLMLGGRPSSPRLRAQLTVRALWKMDAPRPDRLSLAWKEASTGTLLPSLPEADPKERLRSLPAGAIELLAGDPWPEWIVRMLPSGQPLQMQLRVR